MATDDDDDEYKKIRRDHYRYRLFIIFVAFWAGSVFSWWWFPAIFVWIVFITVVTNILITFSFTSFAREEDGIVYFKVIKFNRWAWSWLTFIWIIVRSASIVHVN